MDCKDYDIHDFLEDRYFISWVTNPTRESNQFWDNFIQQYPHKFKVFNQSKTIAKSFLPIEKVLSAPAIEEMRENIESIISRKKKQRILYQIAAACTIIAILGSSIFFLYKHDSNKDINYASIKALVSSSDEIKLILADSSEVKISQSESELKYDANGKLEVNSQIIDLNKNKNHKAFNQLLVPRGKRSSILFSDGSKLWLNSGSRAIYPVKFDPQKREIFIEGEAYLEVSHDAHRTFIVKTANIDVQVLGTSFNVCAYPDDKTTNVVLVKGIIKASVKNHKGQMMLPNQMISYDQKNNKLDLQRVNIFEHIGWKDGWLLCNSEKLDKVCDKLSRYYNRKIRFNDEKAKSLQLSGKLDLKENIEQVLHIISITAPVRMEIINNQIIISSN